MADYKISLGVELNSTNFEAIKTKINSLEKDPIKIRLDDTQIDTQIKSIKQELESLGKTKGLKFDTSALETALTDVKSDITEIKNLLSSLGTGSNTKGLVSSITNISTALDRVSGKFDELQADLSTLAKKDFSINVGVNMGKSAAAVQGDYGSLARDEIIPQLKQQVNNLVKEYNIAYKTVANEQEALVKLVSGTKLATPEFFNDLYDRQNGLATRMGDSSNLKRQIAAYKEFIALFEKAANLKNPDLASNISGASQAANQLATKAEKARTGVDQLDNSLEKLKGVFGSGIDAEKLSTQLDSIVTDLTEIKTSLQGLSSVTNVDSLIQSFNELANTLNSLVSNVELAQNALGARFSGGISNGLKTSANILDAFKRSLQNIGMGANEIDTVADRIKNLGVQIESINQKKSVVASKRGEKEILSVDISGLDKMGNAIKLTEQYDVATGKLIKSIDNVSTVQQKAGASTNSFAKQQKQAVSNLTNQINQLNRAANDQNASRPIKSASSLEALSSKYNEVIAAIQRMGDTSTDTFVDEQNNVRKLISEYKSLVSEFRNAENVSTKMKGTDFASGLSIARNDLEKFKAQAKDFPQITKTIRDLDTAIEGVGDSASLNKFNDQLRVARSELAKIKAETSAANRNEKVGINVSGLESKIADLQRISPEINKFEAKIDGAKVTVQSLLDDLKQVSTQGDFSVVNSKFKAFTDAAKAAGVAVTETSTDIKKLKADADSLSSTASMIKVEGQYNNAERSLRRLSSASDEVKQSFTKLTGSYNELVSAQRNYENVMQQSDASKEDQIEAIKRLIAANKEYQNDLATSNNLIKDAANAEAELAKAQREADNAEVLENKKAGLMSQMNTWLQDNTRATAEWRSRLEELKSTLSGVTDDAGFKKVNSAFSTFKKEAHEAGVEGKTLGETFKNAFSSISMYLSSAALFNYASRVLRSMFEQVKAIDTAMTELKKVTDETDASYNKFLTNAASRAKEIGTTIDGLVESTADFARLGYGFEDAQGLAEVANIYAVVGDEVEGVEGATESLISTMAAFKDEMGGLSNTDFAMSIIDIFNEIGNNFAISSGGLGEALERSASSLAAANNTLQESAALITAANTVTQDPEKVGNAMKTKFLNCLYVQKCA